jgi:hypothetical protein
MPIRVKCVCQQQFDAPDNLAGKTVKCPKCASPIVIPSRAVAMAARPVAPPISPIASLLDEAGVKQRSVTGCPSCGAAFPPDAVLCVECGFNFRTGRKMETMGAAPGFDPGESHTVNAEFLIRRALENQEAEKLMQKKMVSFGIPWWGYLLILIGLIGFIVGMGSLPQDVAMFIAACILFSFGGLIIVAGEIWIKVIAFQDSMLQGFLVLLIEPYETYYMFTHWDECASAFFLWFGGALLIGLGFFALWLSTVLGQTEGEAMLQLIQTAIPV